MPHIFNNHGEKVEYIPNLKPGDLLRAKETVYSRGDSADLLSTFNYAAFEAGKTYEVSHIYLWNGHNVGYVGDCENTMWLALADKFELV